MNPQEEALQLLTEMATFTGEELSACPIARSCAILTIDKMLGYTAVVRPDLYTSYYGAVKEALVAEA